MKRTLILLSLILTYSFSLSAQSSMTDNQVMEYVIKENEKGTSREDIFSNLMKKGVSIEQIQRIRSKYERENGKNQLGTRDITGSKSLENRTRKANGETISEDKARNYKKPGNKRIDNLSESQKLLWQKKQEEIMADEMSVWLPDSLALYEEFWQSKNDEGKQIFGRNIFNRKNLSFEPEMNIATPSDYELGPGDEIYIDIWGASQKSLKSIISPEGILLVEGIGPMDVTGMTVSEANRKLQDIFKKYYADSNVRLSVGQTRTISVNVMGEVLVPGTYSLSAFSTVFHALYVAGGVNEIGTLRDIKVFRHNKQIATVDIYDYILNGNLKGNIRLQSGDVVIISPYNCLVNITGKVKRPMYYEMKETESVKTLIDYAGGFTGDAYVKNLRLIRKKGGKMSVHSIDEFDISKFQLCDGDSLFVDSTLNRYTNLVEIRGAVFRPGKYQMDGKVSTVRQLIETAGGVTEEAFVNRAIMHRRRANRTLEARSIDVRSLMAHKIPDISLQNEDVIFIPSQEDVLGQRTLTISGEVMYPGIYEYADSTTIEDLVLQAGGLTDAASIVKIDVSRRIRGNQAKQASATVAESYTFSIKDGFVIDGKPGFILKPFDEVFVRRSPGYIEQEHVEISGEVAFSGTYVLTKKNQRLSDLVREAGGLTPEAYAQGARLERKLTEEEKLKQQTLAKIAISGDSVDIKKISLGDTRYVGINLDKALEHPGNDEWDVVLKEGDKLVIPQFNNTVSISGEVMYPNTITYKKGESLKYYINQAGGFSNSAKTSRVFAVNMNGTVTRVKSAKDIQPGCELVVPAKSKRKGLSFAELMSMGTMTATLATVIATLVK